MAGPDEPGIRQRHINLLSTTHPCQGSMVNPIYLMGIFQLIMALIIGVIGMMSSSRSCKFSIMWIYFSIALWYIVTTSIGLSPTRRGAEQCSIKYMKKMMKCYRMMCVVGLMLVVGLIVVELIGLFREPEEMETQEWNCVTIHLIILGISAVTVLLTIGGIVTSSRAIVICTTAQRQEGSVLFSVHSNTVSASIGQTHFAMNPDILAPPDYSVDADLPPTYDDVISGKADGMERHTSDARNQIIRNVQH